MTIITGRSNYIDKLVVTVLDIMLWFKAIYSSIVTNMRFRNFRLSSSSDMSTNINNTDYISLTLFCILVLFKFSILIPHIQFEDMPGGLTVGIAGV